jgi:hypothetical protein
VSAGRGPAELRHGRWALLALALGVLLFFWPLAAGRHLVPFHVFAGDPALGGLDLAADRPDWRFFDTSPVTMFYAQKAEAARALREGELPLWNPYASLGAPLLANGQSQPFAPFFLPFLAWPTPWVYSACILAQLLFGGWGMARLLARQGCPAAAGAFGALLFAFNPYALNFCVYSDVWAYVWFPWVFEAGQAWRDGEGGWRRLPVLLALMALGGHLEVAFLGAASLYAFLALQMVHSRCTRAEWRRLALLPPAAALLSAIWLLPFLEYLANVTSPRFGGNQPYPYPPTAPWVVGGELFWPPALAALVAAGLLSPRGRRISLALLPAFLWALLMAFPFPEVLQRAATFDFLSGRYGRSVLWFLLVWMASLGLAAVGEGLSQASRAAAAASAAAVFLAGLWVRMPSLEVLDGRHWVPLRGPSPVEVPALLAAGAAAALLPLFSPSLLAPRRSGLALAGLALASLLPFHAAFGVYWNRSEPRPAPEVRSAAVKGRLWLGHLGKWKCFPPNLGSAFGVRDVRLSDPFVPRRLAALRWPRASHQDLFEAWDGKLARFVGVAEALEVVPGPGGVLRLARREVEGPEGRAFFALRAVRAGFAPEALEGALGQESLSDRVFVEGPAAGGPDPASPPSRTSRSLELLRETAGTQRWRVDAPAGGWLVVRDLYWPGWKARVDGRPVPLLPADGVFRAVALPAGTHQVEFRYRPLSFGLGGVLAVLAGLGLLLSGRRWP